MRRETCPERPQTCQAPTYQHHKRHGPNKETMLDYLSPVHHTGDAGGDQTLQVGRCCYVPANAPFPLPRVCVGPCQAPPPTQPPLSSCCPKPSPGTHNTTLLLNSVKCSPWQPHPKQNTGQGATKYLAHPGGGERPRGVYGAWALLSEPAQRYIPAPASTIPAPASTIPTPAAAAVRVLPAGSTEPSQTSPLPGSWLPSPRSCRRPGMPQCMRRAQSPAPPGG